jgi:N-acetylglucosamine-6-phosphate deacetylase
MDRTLDIPPFAVRGDLAYAGTLARGAVVVERGKIVDVRFDPHDGDLPEQVIDAHIVAPGFVDLQVNGGFGVEIGVDPEAYRVLSARLPETGVTTWLPTLVSSLPEVYPRALAAFDAASDRDGACALGLHLEGPFLSAKRPGAHRPETIASAPDSLITIFTGATAVRLVTLAPERPGGLDRIRVLRRASVAVSLGHTDATYEQTVKGIDAGATMVTHLYSAMSGLHHRAPGAVGAALLDGRVVAGLIADGVHAHPAAVALALRMKGPEGIALVTDMMSAAGMPPGTYPLGGRQVETDATAARLPDGTLAGSLLTMDQAVRNLVAWRVASTGEAIRMATETPADVLGLTDRGSLQVGTRADLVLLDDRLRVQQAVVGGIPRQPRR